MGGKSSKNKGSGGEREVATWLNGLIYAAMREFGYSDFDIEKYQPIVRRNQDQSANGGADLIGTFGLAIEVKRQEALNLSGWWKQARTQAPPNHLPVLLWRQNNHRWQAMTYAWSAMPEGEGSAFVVTLRQDVFEHWFHEWVLWKLTAAKPLGIWPA